MKHLLNTQTYLLSFCNTLAPLNDPKHFLPNNHKMALPVEDESINTNEAFCSSFTLFSLPVTFGGGVALLMESS